MNTKSERKPSERSLQQQYAIKLGRAIPIQMVNGMQEELFHKVFAWLSINQAPEEIIRAVDLSDYLRLIASEMERGELSDESAIDLPETIIEAAGLAVKFGGDFLEWNCGECTLPAWTIKEDGDKEIAEL